MPNERFDRQVRFFGKEGQEKLAAARVAVVGAGGLGSHVIQQLALLGVGFLAPIDSEELADTDRNRLIGARDDDPVPGTRKVDIAERTVKAINPTIRVEKVHDSLVSEQAFAAIVAANYVFGCLDSEGARLVLNELCAAYARPYFDLSSDILPGDPLQYGGHICIAWGGEGCMVCLNVLDRREAQAELAGPSERRQRDELYGIKQEALGEAGPSVVSINGAIASLGVTEFMLTVTGIRPPNRFLTYHGRTGKVVVSTDEPAPDCYYCKGIRGRGDAVNVQRYLHEGVGVFLR